jgi:hypothetical protein
MGSTADKIGNWATNVWHDISPAYAVKQAQEAEDDAEAEEEAEEEEAEADAVETARKKAALRYGLSKTIYTSASGDTSSVATTKKNLLGQ